MYQHYQHAYAAELLTYVKPADYNTSEDQETTKMFILRLSYVSTIIGLEADKQSNDDCLSVYIAKHGQSVEEKITKRFANLETTAKFFQKLIDYQLFLHRKL